MTSSPRCRNCHAVLDLTFVDLGSFQAEALRLNLGASGDPVTEIRLHARVCGCCWLVQLDDAGTRGSTPAIAGLAEHAEHLTGDEVGQIEFPHLLHLIDDLRVEAICPGQPFYPSLLTVEKIATAKGLRVFDVEVPSDNRELLRVHVCRAGASHAETPRLAMVRASEAAARLDSVEGYTSFTERARAMRDGLLAFLTRARASARTVVAYGATAAGGRLLLYCGIGPGLVAFCYDAGLGDGGGLLPGVGIQIVSPSAIQEPVPDFVLVLPNTHKADAMRELAHLRSRGTRFVTATPSLSVTA